MDIIKSIKLDQKRKSGYKMVTTWWPYDDARTSLAEVMLRGVAESQHSNVGPALSCCAKSQHPDLGLAPSCCAKSQHPDSGLLVDSATPLRSAQNDSNECF